MEKSVFEKAIISTASSSEKENNGEPNKNEEMILPKTFATPAFSDKRKVFETELGVSNGLTETAVIGTVKPIRIFEPTKHFTLTSHKSMIIGNVPAFQRFAFRGNSVRVAVALSDTGGRVAVYELAKPGRLPDGVLPYLINGHYITDLQWDPFNDTELAVSCDNFLKFWCVPAGGLLCSTNIPSYEIAVDSPKIDFIRYHTVAKNVMLVATSDYNIKVYDLDLRSLKLILKVHKEKILDAKWSPCGIYIVTLCKNGDIRINKSQEGEGPIRDGNVGAICVRAASITWAFNAKYIICSALNRLSKRIVKVFIANHLMAAVDTVELDNSLTILNPYFHQDSSTVFLTGQSDLIVYMYEIKEENGKMRQLLPHRFATPHHGVVFLPKTSHDHRFVEINTLRLTRNSVEPWSFSCRKNQKNTELASYQTNDSAVLEPQCATIESHGTDKYLNTCEAAKNFAKATDENRPVFEYVQSLPKETANAQTQTPNDLVEGDHPLKNIDRNTPKKDILCETCNKSFTRKQSLRRHTERVHTKENIYKCQKCPKEFFHAENLHKHELIHQKNS